MSSLGSEDMVGLRWIVERIDDDDGRSVDENGTAAYVGLFQRCGTGKDDGVSIGQRGEFGGSHLHLDNGWLFVETI